MDEASLIDKTAVMLIIVSVIVCRIVILEQF